VIVELPSIDVVDGRPCSALESQIRQLRVKFDQWKGLLQSSNTATDITFRLKNDGAELYLVKLPSASLCGDLNSDLQNYKQI
jgi:hypothetical protein